MDKNVTLIVTADPPESIFVLSRANATVTGSFRMEINVELEKNVTETAAVFLFALKLDVSML
jgi:hypothetical protein